MSAGAIAAVVTVLIGGAAVVLADEQDVVVPPSSQAGASTERAEVWAVGDADPPAAEKVAKLIRRADPDRIVYLGDIYPEGTASDFERWAEPWQGLLDLMEPTPGNHDWAKASEGYGPFWEGVRGSPPRSVYSFMAGGWKIISANSEDTRWRRVRDRLRAESRGGGTCRIAFWHRPRYTAGHHEGGNAHAEAFWEAVEGRARILLAGHDHNMQRFRQRDGIVQFVSGAGGRRLYPVNERDKRLAFSNDSRYGALRLDLEPGRAAWRFVDARGRVLDRGTVRCSEP